MWGVSLVLRGGLDPLAGWGRDAPRTPNHALTDRVGALVVDLTLTNGLTATAFNAKANGSTTQSPSSSIEAFWGFGEIATNKEIVPSERAFGAGVL